MCRHAKHGLGSYFNSIDKAARQGSVEIALRIARSSLIILANWPWSLVTRQAGSGCIDPQVASRLELNSRNLGLQIICSLDRIPDRKTQVNIASNDVLHMNRRSAEERATNFADFGDAIRRTPDLDLPDPKSVPVDLPVLVEEAKNGCTMGMIHCLDLEQRLIFTLGEILGVSDTVGSEILEMSADNFRQCLSRARRDLYQFMNNQCGLVNSNNPCRCPKKTKGFIDGGHVDPDHLLFVPLHVRRIREAAAGTVREIEDVLDRQYAAVYRDHPFLQPSDQIDWLRRVLDRPDIRTALHLT